MKFYCFESFVIHAEATNMTVAHLSHAEFFWFYDNRALQFFVSKPNLKLNQDTEFSHFHTKRI